MNVLKMSFSPLQKNMAPEFSTSLILEIEPCVKDSLVCLGKTLTSRGIDDLKVRPSVFRVEVVYQLHTR